MAKRTNKGGAKSSSRASKSEVVSSTPVRNSPVPPAASVSMRRDVTHEDIARRAYEISQSNSCGSEMDNWLRAERELSGGAR